MAKTKVTISLDRSHADEVIRLTGATSTSAAIDLALLSLIRSERLRRDLHAYGLSGVTDDEIALAQQSPNWSDLADETDWDDAFTDAT